MIKFLKLYGYWIILVGFVLLIHAEEVLFHITGATRVATEMVVGAVAIIGTLSGINAYIHNKAKQRAELLRAELHKDVEELRQQLKEEVIRYTERTSGLTREQMRIGNVVPIHKNI